MNKRHLLYIHLILLLLASKVHGQITPYILGEDLNVFSNIEELLLEDELDSVFILSDMLIQTNSDIKVKGTANFYKGQSAYGLQQYEFAQSSFDKALELFKQCKYDKALAMLYCKMADLNVSLDDYKTAENYYQLSIHYATKLNLFELQIDVYLKKAKFHTSIKESDITIYYLKDALQLAIKIKDEDQIKIIINQISTNYHSNGQLDSAIFYFQYGLNLKKGMKDQDGLISDYSALGKLYRERGNYKKAQKSLMEALNIAETEGDTFSITTIYSELGDIYAAQGIWNVSENYYSKVIELARIKKSRFMEAGCLKQLGYIFQEQKKDSLALVNYNASLKLFAQLKNKAKEAEVIIRISQIYKNDNQFEKAKILLEETLQTSSLSQDLMSSLSTKLALAEIEIKLGHHQKGIKYAEECLNAFEKMKDKENMRQSFIILSRGYALSYNWKKAYQFHIDYSHLSDSLTSIEQAETIKKYDLLVTTKKKDEEIAEQHKMINNQEISLLKKNNLVLLLTTGIGFIGLITILLLFVYRKNRQMNKQKIQVLKKEQETQRLKSIIEGEEKERKRLARELHDGLGAVLATVKMQISGIQYKYSDAQSSNAFQKAEILIDDACRTVREISHDLMPYVLEQQGLISAIEDMCLNFSNQHDLSFDCIPYGNEDNLNDILKITIYRITQELLKNITKHAQAKEVIVQLTIEEDEIILIVEDDGKGFDTSFTGNGIGLENIHSRANYLNGSFEIDSTIGTGSTFIIQLPIKRD